MSAIEKVTAKSEVVSEDEIHEDIVNGIIDQMGELPEWFNVMVIVTVIIEPLPERAK